jgi:ribosome-associated toxin RatA of RatAB toxin-antitoxin module
MTLNLVSRVTVRFSDSSRDLVARVTTRIMATKNLVSRVSVVEETPATMDLVATVNVRQTTAKNLTSQVTVYFTSVSENLVSRVTVLVASSRALVCHLYADQTE